MTRVRNILIALLLVAGLGYLGLKGYIYYQVKSRLDDAIAKAAPMAEITYGGIDSSLSGSVTVHDIAVRAFGEEVRIGASRLGTPNVLVLLGALSELQQGEPPEFVELEWTDLNIGLDGPLMGFVQAAVQRQAPQLPGSFPCGGKVVFGPADWRAMGYQRLSSDVRMHVAVDKDAHRVRLQGSWKTADMGAVRFRTEFAGLAPSMNGLAEANKTALLRWFELDYTDLSYYKRWVRYCAQRDKTDPNAFINTLVDAKPTYYMYSWGVVPGADLRRAFGEFLRNPKTLSVVAHPSAPVELDLLKRYSPDDLVAVLDLRVLVNGQGVESSRVSYEPELLQQYARGPSAPLQWPPRPSAQAPAATPAPSAPSPQPLASAPPQPAPEATPKSAPKPTSKAAPEPAAKAAPQAPGSNPGSRPSTAAKVQPRMTEFGYRTVATAGLERYVGRYVRVLTREGTAREGVLSAVQANEVVVERRMYGGSVGVPVPMSKIDRVEVWLPQDS